MQRSLLKPHASLFAAILRASDPVATALVGIVGYAVYLREFPLPEHYVLFLVAGALVVAFLFPMFRLYEPQRGVSIIEEVRSLVLAWLLVTGLIGGAIFATKTGDSFSRVWVTLWLAGGFAATAVLRVSVRLVLRTLRRRGLNLRHIAIVGAGKLGATIADRVQQATWAGYSVVGFYDDDAAKIGTEIAGRRVLASPDVLAHEIDSGAIDQVWIALPLRAERRIREILTLLRASSVEVRFVPDIYSFHLLNHSITEVAGLPVVSLTETPMSGPNRIAKAIEDFLVAMLLLVPALPLMALIAIGIRLSSPGPIFYRQHRVTWNGESFEMLKFRTMPVGAESGTGPVWAKPGESRATPFGARLRRLSLDELPQLFNVLKGEMSLVGPRPERPEFVEQFRRQVPGYMQKHLVKAGITGWAQIHDLRGSSDLVRRVEYDLFYIENWSVWLDLRILALTLGHVLKSRNAH
jgi:putative colanic acid biosynthesis UDP-glucose lipid carrier transferase